MIKAFLFTAKGNGLLRSDNFILGATPQRVFNFEVRVFMHNSLFVTRQMVLQTSDGKFFSPVGLIALFVKTFLQHKVIHFVYR